MLKRAMSREVASYKKRNGHVNERLFARLIEGMVVGARTDKTDVIDQQSNTYSVKSGEWWQIFLYGRDRFLTDTEFHDIGNIANLFMDCIDAFPENRNIYVDDKTYFKERLQHPMRQLKNEICKPTIFAQLLLKGIFNRDEVDYLSILPIELTDRSIPLDQKHFHVFSASEVTYLLSTKLQIQNSKARNYKQMDDQKVIFRYRDKNVGEIEIRTDSDIHYRQAKWRFNAPSILELLRSNLEVTVVKDWQISVYGSVIQNLL